MTSATETLCAIERRAKRAVVQELRLMTQEILALRTLLSMEDRAHADALLLKLDHLERCQQVDTLPPPGLAHPADAPVLPLAFDALEPLEPSAYLVCCYSRDLGDLEQLLLTETLQAAVQLVLDQLAAEPRPVDRVVRRTEDGELVFLAADDRVLACIAPCDPRMPDVAPEVASACDDLRRGDLLALQRLIERIRVAQAELLAA